MIDTDNPEVLRDDFHADIVNILESFSPDGEFGPEGLVETVRELEIPGSRINRVSDERPGLRLDERTQVEIPVDGQKLMIEIVSKKYFLGEGNYSLSAKIGHPHHQRRFQHTINTPNSLSTQPRERQTSVYNGASGVIISDTIRSDVEADSPALEAMKEVRNILNGLFGDGIDK